MNKKFNELSPLTEASYYVLLSLYEQSHGYGVIKKVEELTKGRLVIAAGTLYGIIRSFLKHGLITLVDESGSRSKKIYKITNSGTELLNFEVKRLQELTKNAREVLQ